MGRNLNALTTQYRVAHHPFDGHLKPLQTDPAFLIYEYGEMLPICTKKWRLALKEFFNDNYEGPDFVFTCAALAHVLSKLTGYSRLIEAGVYYEDLVNNYNSSEVLVNGLTRDEYYYKWASDEKFAIIKPVALKVGTQIFQHYRDIMDKPRRIGKYKNIENE